MGVPRFDNLANIKRSLLCAEELSYAGMSVIPYVAGVTQRDWVFWGDFLREHKEISVVAKEFQTGGRNTSVAEWHIQQLLRVQDHVKRGLRLVAIGARRHLKKLMGFAGVTLSNSDPFMKTCHRFLLMPTGQWEHWPTLPDEPLDELLRINVQRYGGMIRNDLALAKMPSISRPVIPKPLNPAQLQLRFVEAVRISGDLSAQQMLL